MVLGSRALRQIRATGVHYANEQNIVIGRVLGMVISLLMVASLAFVLIFIVVIGLTAAAGSY